jgi:hypothetical protein
VPNAARYAREKAAASARNTTPYKERIAKGESKGYTAKQAAGKAKGSESASVVKELANRLGVPIKSVADRVVKTIKGTTFFEKKSPTGTWDKSTVAGMIELARSQGKTEVRAIYKKPGAKHGNTSSWMNIASDANAAGAASAIAAGLDAYDDDDEHTPEYDGDDLYALAFV